MLKVLCRDVRYWVILGIYLLVLIFGRSQTGIAGQPGEFIYNSPFYGGDYILAEFQRNTVVRDQLNSNTGDFYRIIFGARADQDLLDANDVQSPIGLSLSSSNGQDQTVGVFEVPRGAGFKMFEKIIKTDGIFKDLTVNRTDNDSLRGNIYLKNLVFTRLNVQSLEEAGRLSKSLYGPFDFTEIDQANQNDAGVIYDLIKKDDIVGEVVKANSDLMTGVSFAIDFFGNGGLGNYQMEIRKAEKSNNGFVVGKEILSNIEFSSAWAESVYHESDPRKGNVYRFPLTYKTEKGKYYFIGIKNTADINWLNHLRFHGSHNSADHDGASLVISPNGNTKQIGDLYFIEYGIPETQNSLQSGTIIQDIGGGIGDFSFDLKNTPLKKLPIVKTGENENIYQVATGFPFIKLALDAEVKTEDESKVKLYVSPDGQNWQVANEDLETPNTFLTAVNNGILSRDLYLKVAFDKNTKPTNINFSTLRINGNLSLNE